MMIYRKNANPIKIRRTVPGWRRIRSRHRRKLKYSSWLMIRKPRLVNVKLIPFERTMIFLFEKMKLTQNIRM